MGLYQPQIRFYATYNSDCSKYTRVVIILCLIITPVSIYNLIYHRHFKFSLFVISLLLRVQLYYRTYNTEEQYCC